MSNSSKQKNLYNYFLGGNFKLDRYMTGRQTPGGEVWTDLMLDKNTEFRQSAESSGLIRRPTDASRPSWATDEKERVSTGWGRSYKPKGSLRGLGTNGWQIRRKERAANGKFGGVKEQGTSSSVGAVKKEEGADIGMDYKMEIEATEKGVEILQEEVVSVLEPLMSQFPLIKSGEESLDSSQVTYPTAESLESFESMSEAERITFEENRASAILSHATSALDLPPSHGIHSLSIETLTKWCRLAGYTPVYEGDDEPVETRVLSNATEGGNSGTTDMQLDLPAVEQQLQEPIKPIVPHVKKKEPLPFCKFCGRRHKKPQSEDAKTGSEGVKEEGEETQGLDDPLALYCITQIQPSLSLSGGMSSLSTAEPLLESLKSLKQVSKSNSGSSDTLSNIWDGAAPIRASQNDLAFIWSSVAQIGVAIPDDDEDDQDDEMGEEERHLRRNQRSTSPQKVVADGNESAEIMDEEVRRTPRNVVGGLLYEVMRVFCKRLLKESEAVYREQSDFVVEGISDANSPSIASNANDTNIGNQGLVERRPAASSSTCSNTPIEEGRNRRGLLVPMHVRAAAVRNPQFDFLTNRYLGTFENE
ncbi:hypothetical protein BCR33DRAFT_854013 [Rhizoclosmatium globosum]|uniref:YEATS domain-containing protein n=1 Tax=Rhizoclosmatium globosum TaxID=329046 RepID=A0A1Y2BUJ1_9FUNG|nr:hypothetical protein BCR33DRAFT_854013 [Rhizoclosmatium globosum]|eukprot:ORY38344.1 hypothetical protein BCR33DRAFT_854013 [Rhizoclosmatium globosum]